MAFARHTVSIASVFVDALVILGISILIGVLYHLVVYGMEGPIRSFVGVGATAVGCRASSAANTS